jgi:hypothetical protein
MLGSESARYTIPNGPSSEGLQERFDTNQGGSEGRYNRAKERSSLGWVLDKIQLSRKKYICGTTCNSLVASKHISVLQEANQTADGRGSDSSHYIQLKNGLPAFILSKSSDDQESAKSPNT